MLPQLACLIACSLAFFLLTRSTHKQEKRLTPGDNQSNHTGFPALVVHCCLRGIELALVNASAADFVTVALRVRVATLAVCSVDWAWDLMGGFHA